MFTLKIARWVTKAGEKIIETIQASPCQRLQYTGGPFHEIQVKGWAFGNDFEEGPIFSLLKTPLERGMRSNGGAKAIAEVAFAFFLTPPPLCLHLREPVSHWINFNPRKLEQAVK